MCEVVNNAYEQKELRIVVGEPNPPSEMNFKQTPLSVQEVEFAGTLGLSNPKISPDGISFDLEAFSMHRPAGVEMRTEEGEVDEVNEAACNQGATTGGMTFLLSLVTCGIYALYWYYKAGEYLYAAKSMRGMYRDSNSGIVFLLKNPRR